MPNSIARNTLLGAGLAALLAAAPVSLHWSPARTPSLSVDRADARTVRHPILGTIPEVHHTVYRRLERQPRYHTGTAAAALAATGAYGVYDTYSGNGYGQSLDYASGSYGNGYSQSPDYAGGYSQSPAYASGYDQSASYNRGYNNLYSYAPQGAAEPRALPAESRYPTARALNDGGFMRAVQYESSTPDADELYANCVDRNYGACPNH